MIKKYKSKVCYICGAEFSPTTGSSKLCSTECKDKNRRILERKKDFKKKWSKAVEVYCANCNAWFFTTDSRKKYCGIPSCEKERKASNSRKAEIKRRGNRSEYTREAYLKKKEKILRDKKDKYRESKNYPVREGSSTERLSLDSVRDVFNLEGYTLNSDVYVNNRSKVNVTCPENHNWDVSVHNFKDCNNRCYYCYLESPSSSAPEKSILELFRSRYPAWDIVHNDREVLCGKELDILFTEKKVAVEYCGLRWHGESFSGKERNYHRKKMEMCLSKGIRLITIFEDEFIERPGAVISRIESALGSFSKNIFARKCSLQEIDKSLANSFLSEYHLQGKSGFKKAWGLFFEGRLVQVMTAGSLSRSHADANKGLIELKRLASLPGMVVVGGASRLFKALTTWAKREGYLGIKSYCDMRWANPFRTVYDILGFEKVSETKYTPHYFKGQRRYRNQSLRKTPEERLTGKTEWELRQAQGYDRIWDCGHRTYVYKFSFTK